MNIFAIRVFSLFLCLKLNRMKKLLTFLTLFAGLFLTANAQVNRCATMEVRERMLQEHPELIQETEQAERLANIWMEKHGNSVYRLGGNDTIVIPVVVHVVYKTAAQNISDEKIFEQIRILNEDYARLNADTVDTPSPFKSKAGGMKLKFCLAQRDPNNLPTNGIVRVLTTKNSFSQNDGVKYAAQGGSSAWPRGQYLNLWVCNLDGGLLGYAQFPGQAAATDGVVILYSAFGITTGQYNLGRTTTHEVGHWLGLYHIWGDDGAACSGSDGITDTNNQADEHYGCPSYPQNSCSNTASGGDMFNDYMDYTDDRCMDMFTIGQCTKMLSVLNSSRSSLLTSNGCNSPGDVLDARIINIGNPSAKVYCGGLQKPMIRIRNTGTITVTSLSVEYGFEGGASQTVSISGILNSLNFSNVTLPSIVYPTGNATFYAKILTVNGVADAINPGETLTRAINVATGTGVYPFSDGFENPFPGTTFELLKSDPDTSWVRTNRAKKTGTYSLWMDYYNYPYIGAVDEFTLPAINLSGATNPRLIFDRAYAQYEDATNGILSDTLEIWVQVGCSGTPQRVWRKFGTDLATSANTDQDFKPTAANQWKTDSISLLPYLGNNEVYITFRGISNFANNLYLENLNIRNSVVTGVNYNLLGEDRLNIFPNPTTNQFHLTYDGENSGILTVQLLDITGKLLNTLQLTYNKGYNDFQLEAPKGYSGNLLININDGTGFGTRKLLVF